ncbi:MAG: LuxR C-terminal-related transcriptional regulator, partial [Caldilinea sp.]|nr:LuxR C-terminal-related transcriptional regulator [Caldilinea sp.]MDW8440305.1 LuxR C-terminal-related transcriptional regulator [Caldilineaceae bacterium]
HQALDIVSSKDWRVIGLASLALGGAHRQLANFERSETALRRAIQASRNADDRMTETLATAHLALMAIQYGRLRLAASVAAEAIQRLTEVHTAPPVLGALHGALGRVYYEWNDLQAAQDHLEQGVRLSALAGHNASRIYTLCALARLFQAEGKLEEADRCLDEATALLAQGAPGWVRPELIARRVGLALAQGDAATAEMLLWAGGLDPDAPVNDRTEALHLAWLRLFLVRGDAQAAHLAQRIIAVAEAGGRRAALIQALLLTAQLEADSPSRAAAHLQRALALAEPEGFVRVFLEEGPTLAALLQQMGPPPWLAHVIPAVGHPSSQQKAMASLAPERTEARGDDVLCEPLSAREMAVLRLLAEGLTYAEIAERLVVSLNTVRFHIKEIYGKLGVNRRAQAVQQAQELGLL